MTDKIKGDSKFDMSVAKPVNAAKIAHVNNKDPIRRLPHKKLANTPQNASNTQAVGTGPKSNSPSVVGAAVQSDSKQQERERPLNVLPADVRSISALANQRKEIPYSDLKIFEKIALIHSTMVKMNSDARFGEESEAVAIVKEHFFLIFELERLTHVR